MFVFQRKINDKDALIIQNSTDNTVGGGNRPIDGAQVIALYVDDEGKFTYECGTLNGDVITPGEQPGGLPEVTIDDDGKVLTVSGGSWVAGSIDLSGYVPTTRKVNNKALSEDITLNATDIGIDLSTKQDKLVSGTNIKTINNESILGSGNVTISGGTEVIANPTNTTATLTSIGIGNTNYAVGGNSTSFIPYKTVGEILGIDISEIDLSENYTVNFSVEDFESFNQLLDEYCSPRIQEDDRFGRISFFPIKSSGNLYAFVDVGFDRYNNQYNQWGSIEYVFNGTMSGQDIYGYMSQIVPLAIGCAAAEDSGDTIDLPSTYDQMTEEQYTLFKQAFRFYLS